MKVGTLEIQMMADLARLAKDMHDMKRMVGNSMKEVESMVGSAKTALAGLGAGLSVGAVVTWAKHIVDSAEEINKLSQKTGIAVGELSKLQYAAKLSDVGTEALAKGVKHLAGNVIEAGDTTSKAGKLFTAMGVDISGGPMKVLPRLAEVFSRLEDGEVKTTLATVLFGRAGMDLIPLLNRGSEGLGKLSAEAERLGLVMSAETARSAEEFNDNLRGVKGASEGAGRALLNAATGPMVAISNAMKEAAIDGGLLKALLVGFGGILYNAFSDENIDRVRKIGGEIKKLAEEAENLEKIAARGPGLLERLLGMDESANITARAMALREEIRKLRAERDALLRAPTNPAGFMNLALDFAAKQIERARIAGALSGGGVAEDTAYKNLVKTLKEKLLVDHELTEVNKLQLTLDAMSAKELAQITPARKAELMDLAKRVDAKNAERAALEALLKAEEAWLDVMAEVNALEADKEKKRADAILATEKTIDQIKFETTLIGKSNEERELAIALRNLELQGITKETQGYEGLVERLRDAIQAQQAARAANEQLVASQRDSARGWEDLVDRVLHGFGDMKRALQDFAKELLIMFAKKYVLQMIAGISGNPALSAAAGAAGQGTAASLGSGFLGATLGSTALGAGASTFFSAATGSFVGPIAEGFSMAGMGTMLYNAIAAIPVWGWIVAGLATIAAILSKPRGGPKDEGENTSMFGPDGRLISSSASGFNITGTSSDPAMAQFTGSIAQGFFAALHALGGSSSGIGFGGSIVRDPRGKSPTFVDTSVLGANGQVLYSQHNANVGRSDDELKAELSLQSQRAILAALQASTLPPMVATILNTLVAETASLDEINAAMADAQKYQQAYAAFQQSFMTDAEKLVEAQRQLTAGFDALGIQAPTTVEEFKKLVKDAWDNGDKALFDSLMQLAPAFRLVSDAATQAANDATAAAAAMMNEFDALMGRLRPGYTSGLLGLQQGSALDQFRAGNAWVGNQSNASLIAALRTITREDFASYSAANQQLILTILGLDDQIAGLGNGATDTAAAITDLGDAADTSAAAFEQARLSLRTWLAGLLLNQQLSPLTPAQQLAEARRQYETTLGLAQHGDLGAMNNLQGVSEAYLRIMRDLFGSNPAYSALFSQITSEVGGVAGVDQRDTNTRMRDALPSNGRKMAAAEDVQDVQSAVRELIAAISRGITVHDPEATAEITRAISDAAPPTTGALT